jgi:hypothetical protein
MNYFMVFNTKIELGGDRLWVLIELAQNHVQYGGH